MCVEKVEFEKRVCPCGCAQEVPVYFGMLRYGPDHFANFAVTHMEHCDGGPHAWFVLGSGPWFPDDDRDCWVTMHLYTNEENVVTRIEDPEKSPFCGWGDLKGDRLLTRAEVLAQDGGREWAIDRRVDFEEHHLPTKEFLNGPPDA